MNAPLGLPETVSRTSGHLLSGKVGSVLAFPVPRVPRSLSVLHPEDRLVCPISGRLPSALGVDYSLLLGSLKH